MFTNIKDKLLTVTKNVTKFNKTSDNCELFSTNSVNFNAGSDLLSHFKKQWEIIHATNEENAKNVEKQSKIIETITNCTSKNKENLTLITHIFDNSNFKQNICNCLKQIQNLYDSFEQVERNLIQLENVIEETEFNNMKEQHKYHLEQYKIRKHDSLVKFEDDLKENHQKKLENYELNHRKLLEERQQVFQEAFKNDLETFKNLGSIPKLDLPKTSALLEEIQLDYDENELDQFFNDVTDTK